jgi:hypothetical protein
MVSLEPPHPPYDAPAAGVEPRDPREIVLPFNVPRGGDVETKARRELAGYYAHLEATDRAIGRMLAQLPPENTVVVVTSVHGDMHGAHGLFRKGWPHEESVRVPLLVRGMSQVGTGDGLQSSALVSLIDLPRWAERWAQHGASAPLAAAVRQQISMPSVVHLPHQCDRVWRGVRTASRKLVVTEDGAPWLFFDLERDAGENHNVVGEARCAAEITEMRRWL